MAHTLPQRNSDSPMGDDPGVEFSYDDDEKYEKRNLLSPESNSWIVRRSILKKYAGLCIGIGVSVIALVAAISILLAVQGGGFRSGGKSNNNNNVRVVKSPVDMRQYRVRLESQVVV